LLNAGLAIALLFTYGLYLVFMLKTTRAPLPLPVATTSRRKPMQVSAGVCRAHW